MIIRSSLGMLLGLLAGTSFAASTLAATTLSSPDQHLQLKVELSAQQQLVYSVARDSQVVILPSALGLQLDAADFTQQLKLAQTSPVKSVTDTYEMLVGKRRINHYAANEQVVTIENASHQKMDVVFRVSNDGVAFRYIVSDSSVKFKKFVRETTSFALDDKARAWLQPIAVAQTGFANTNPSYEEHYLMNIPVGTASPSKAGWVFPALFNSGDSWVVLTEADMDGSWHASRLQAASPGGVYQLGTPMAAEVFTDGKTAGTLLAESKDVLRSPWRIIGVGSLPGIMNSNLGSDLAAPAIKMDASIVKPGHASWSWALLKDDFTTFDVQKKFIDYAADMHWEYTLIDADWDKKIGYAKLRQLVEYGATKNVGVLVWYNSSGAWNTTKYSPKSQLLTAAQRKQEFARLRDIGVKGVKVDFFAGDGQSMIAYYIAILKDAADAGLLVNFHGSTLPRGWARTYPNLMSMEAVKGLEFTTFGQKDQDAVATHAAMLPFARNLFDPMDFTPMVFADIPKIERKTRNGFELAESVLFLSGIQHFAEIPEGMATVPAYVKSFLQTLPVTWDDSRFVDGYPGQFVVIARRAGKAWYVAAINATDSDKTVNLDLSFIGDKKAQMISDGDSSRAFVQQPVQAVKDTRITIKTHGGFVAVFE
ncbi:glycoside hydrolase family 97 catalytic domain-containing protein [Undibacterium sp. CY18W]|uniref:Glycoside hydrolase family 97 catalytic domain-containing protein n=1 Tax=Undibacterium hunanense TaxID=2762292 RepID=A0ABR6ZPF8_9BURK|nr:glycoside hydrolase family 97 protein [Undibacterium hunanense]MBC3917468.1 glycoside hydrolase family 97 catalytic domain-containing protein [Undibacterium hunanense]